jgi:hypothetical protein
MKRILVLGLAAGFLVSAPSYSRADSVGPLIGGLIGGAVLGGIIASQQQPQAVYVPQPYPVYVPRKAPRVRRAHRETPRVGRDCRVETHKVKTEYGWVPREIRMCN